MASVGGATTAVNNKHMADLSSMWQKKTTGHRCVEHKATPQLATHPPHTSNRTNREDHQVTSTRKGAKEVPVTRAAT